MLPSDHSTVTPIELLVGLLITVSGVAVGYAVDFIVSREAAAKKRSIDG